MTRWTSSETGATHPERRVGPVLETPTHPRLFVRPVCQLEYSQNVSPLLITFAISAAATRGRLRTPDLDLATPNGVGDPNPSSTVPSPLRGSGAVEAARALRAAGHAAEVFHGWRNRQPSFRDPTPTLARQQRVRLGIEHVHGYEHDRPAHHEVCPQRVTEHGRRQQGGKRWSPGVARMFLHHRIRKLEEEG